VSARAVNATVRIFLEVVMVVSFSGFSGDHRPGCADPRDAASCTMCSQSQKMRFATALRRRAPAR
jgi:hypothetical protein